MRLAKVKAEAWVLAAWELVQAVAWDSAEGLVQEGWAKGLAQEGSGKECLRPCAL
jgi:hypothetical protein